VLAAFKSARLELVNEVLWEHIKYSLKAH
jgi:hypothetical protein